MAARPKLTPAEWEIMDVVWRLGGAPAVREVLDAAYPNGEKAYTTVQTVMNTLVKKGLLSRQKTGLVNFYRPTRERDALNKDEMRSVLARVFQGSVPALASSLMSLDDIELEEIEEIKALLAEKERELKEDPS